MVKTGFWKKGLKSSSVYPATRIALIYILIGVLWIVFSDQFAQYLFDDISQLSWFQTIKGICYVALTAGIIFYLVYRHASKTKLTTKVLQKREELLTSATKAANDGIWDWNISTNEIYVSDKFLKLFSYTKNEFSSDISNIEKLIQDSNPNRVLRYFRKLLTKNKTGIELETRLLTKNNELRWFLIKGQASAFKNDIPTRFTGTISDETDRKVRLLEIEESKSTLEMLFHENIEGIFLVHFPYPLDSSFITSLQEDNKNFKAACRILKVNKALLQFFQLDERIENKTLLEFEELLGFELPIHWQCLIENKIIQLRSVVVQKENNNQFYDASIIATQNDTNQLSGFYFILTDVTEREKAKRKQKLVYSIANAANQNITIDEFYARVWEEINKVFNFKNFYIALYDENCDSFFCPFLIDEVDNQSLFKAKGTLSKYILDQNKALFFTRDEMEHMYLSGSIDKVGPDAHLWMGAPFEINDGQKGLIAMQSYEAKVDFVNSDVNVLAFAADQIGRSLGAKIAEEKLLEAKQKAEESDRLKSAFLANMSHEIRTPLNAIIGFINLFSEEDIDDEQRDQYKRYIQKSSDNLLQIISDIVDISALDSNQLNIEESDFELNEVLQLSIDYGKQELQNQNKNSLIDFKVHIPEQIKYSLNSDKERFLQVIKNLINNAVKFTDSGLIELGVNEQESNIQVYVRDTGIGIEKDQQKLIFERFRQGEDGLTKLYGGNGLGLSISKQLMKLMKGKITVSSTPQMGSIFNIEIPFSSKQEEVSEVLQTQEEYKPNRLRDKTILIAEDEDINYMLLFEILKNSEAILLRARNGQEAIDIVNKTNIDIVLMDIQMPEINGLEATELIKERFPNLPIIAQTAYATPSDRIKCLEAGCDDYISKPIGAENLLGLLHLHLPA